MPISRVAGTPLMDAVCQSDNFRWVRVRPLQPVSGSRPATLPPLVSTSQDTELFLHESDFRVVEIWGQRSLRTREVTSRLLEDF